MPDLLCHAFSHFQDKTFDVTAWAEVDLWADATIYWTPVARERGSCIVEVVGSAPHVSSILRMLITEVTFIRISEYVHFSE